MAENAPVTTVNGSGQTEIPKSDGIQGLVSVVRPLFLDLPDPELGLSGTKNTPARLKVEESCPCDQFLSADRNIDRVVFVAAHFVSQPSLWNHSVCVR